MKVNIDPSFNTEQRDAIVQSFNNWQAAGGTNGNNSGVTFTFTYNQNPPTIPPPVGTYVAQVWNQNPIRDPFDAGDSETGTNGTHLVYQQIWLNRQTTDSCALGQTTSHEIGHGFGLGECPNCPSGSSVMNAGYHGYNSLDGDYGPTLVIKTKLEP